MGSPVSQHYLEILDHHVFDGVTLWGAAFNDDQRLRTIIAREAWAVWLKNPMIDQMDLVRRISTRIYSEVLMRAETDERWRRLADYCKLRPGVKRTPAQLRNDVEVLNHLVAMSESPAPAIERAKVQRGSDWLMRHGMEHGDPRAVASGAKIKMELYNNFDEKQEDYTKVANVAVNVTGDVSIVKSDRQNYSDEEKRRLAKKYGLSMSEVVDLVEREDGSFATEEAQDIDPFVEKEGV